MKIFQLAYPADVDDEPKHAGTLSEIKDKARAVPQTLRKEHVVHELEVQTDKAGVVAALNRAPIVKIMRTFAVTPRGSLKEEVA